MKCTLKGITTFLKGLVTKTKKATTGLTDTPPLSESPITTGTQKKENPIDLSIRLSKNFYLKDLVRSDTAERLGIDNTPTDEEVEKLWYLTETVLQPIRDLINAPLMINSGFRSLELNANLNVSRIEDKRPAKPAKSQHTKAEAADIRCNIMSAAKLAKTIAESDIEFDQLILEYNARGSEWVHISKVSNGNRRQILTINSGMVSLGLVSK